jgi:prepilin-type N-terminal cleavage/methylation domain-containing protein
LQVDTWNEAPLGHTTDGVSAQQFIRMRLTIAQSMTRTLHGFTLAEVLISLALVGMMIGGIITSYLAAAQRSEWASASAAAHRLAVMKMEQLKAAPWEWLHNEGKGRAQSEINTLDMPRTVMGSNDVILHFSSTPRTNTYTSGVNVVFLVLEVTLATTEPFPHLRNFTPPPLRTYRAPE